MESREDERVRKIAAAIKSGAKLRTEQCPICGSPLVEIKGEIGEVVAGRKPGRTSDHEITVYDSTGLSILDVATGELVMRKAEREGVGIWLEI